MIKVVIISIIIIMVLALLIFFNAKYTIEKDGVKYCAYQFGTGKWFQC